MSDVDLGTDVDEAADIDANDRVHHHAYVGDDAVEYGDGSFQTLCGLRITPRRSAGTLPCCPMCALVIGKPCTG